MKLTDDLDASSAAAILLEASCGPGIMGDFRAVRLPPEAQPLLFTVVDTEEEFDWNAPFSRNNTGVRAIRKLEVVQKLFSRYGVRPTYVIDFPVASQRDAYQPLKDFAASGDCRIGAHLHPWVNPPFQEALSREMSYGCNLSPELEAEKIRVLKLEIGNNLNVEARAYKAGRYGFGPSTAAALQALDFDIDLSVNPHMDFSADGGPSFEAFEATPYFFGDSRTLLELPCTTGYSGIAGRFRASLHRFASSDRLRRARLVGVLARLGIVNRVMLSPEGFTLFELRQLTETLLGCGIRTFSLTFHSPSLEPGCTPYVTTQSELDRFVSTIEAYCDFFFGAVGGATATPEEFRESIGEHAASVAPERRFAFRESA